MTGRESRRHQVVMSAGNTTDLVFDVTDYFAP